MGLLNLIARLSLNATHFEAGLNKADGLVSKFGRNVKGQLAAAFGTGAIIAATKNAIDYAGKIDDLSVRLGVSTTALQEFDYAARQNGATLDNVTSALDRLAKARSEALGDTQGTLAGEFAKLGVTIDDLKKKRLEELFKQIGNAFREAKDPQQLIAAGLETMGRSAGILIPAMATDFDDAASRAHDLGIVIRDDVIDALQSIGDTIEDLKMMGRGLLSSELVRFLNFFVGIGHHAIGTVKGIGAALGAMSAGGDADQAFQQAIDEYAAGVEGAKVERFISRRRKRSLPSTDFTGRASRSSGGTTKLDRPNINSLQQIGAFIGVDPMILEQRNANRTLAQVSNTLKKIESNTNPSNVGRSEW